MDGTKEGIRREMRRRRRQVAPGIARQAEAAALRHLRGFAPYQGAAAVLAYVATDGEFPTGRVLRLALRDGKRVFLPCGTQTGMDFAEHRPGAALRIGRYGIPEPAGARFDASEFGSVVVLLPLIAWDGAGVRLGRGGGHYDRALANRTAHLCLVGLGYGFQQCVELPADPWDVPMDYVLTERGVTRCMGGSHPPPTRKEATLCHGLRLDRFQSRVGDRAGVGSRLPAPPSD